MHEPPQGPIRREGAKGGGEGGLEAELELLVAELCNG